MKKNMNLTDLMNQCNSAFKTLKGDIEEKARVIRSKRRAVDSGRYSYAVTESLRKQIEAYEQALQEDRTKIDEVEYELLACQYVLWESEIEKRGANLPTPRKLSIFNPLRRFHNEDSIPEGAMEEILDKMIELNLILKTEEQERELIAIEERKRGTVVSDVRRNEINEEAVKQILNNTTYKKEIEFVLGDIDKYRAYKRAEPHDIRDRLIELAIERGKPSHESYTNSLKEKDDDQEER